MESQAIELYSLLFITRITTDLKMVPGTGLEPVSPKAQDFKSCVYTNSTTPAMGREYNIHTLLRHLNLHHHRRIGASFVEQPVHCWPGHGRY